MGESWLEIRGQLPAHKGEGFCKSFSGKVVRASRLSHFEPGSYKSFQSTPEGDITVDSIFLAWKCRALAATDHVLSSMQIDLYKQIMRRFSSNKRNIIFSLKLFHYMSNRTIVLILFLFTYFNPGGRAQKNLGPTEEMQVVSLTMPSTTWLLL